MGKSVVVLPGFYSVEGPSVNGPRVYQAGATIVYTDAEYGALPTTITRCLNIAGVTTVPDPSRPPVDFYLQTGPIVTNQLTRSFPVNVVNPATGTVTVPTGPSSLLLTGNVTIVLPAAPTGTTPIVQGSAVSGGNESRVTLYLTQDATGSRTLTLPSSVKKAGGTAITLSTAANAVDYLEFKTINGGVTWLLVNKQLAIA